MAMQKLSVRLVTKYPGLEIGREINSKQYSQVQVYRSYQITGFNTNVGIQIDNKKLFFFHEMSKIEKYA